MRDLSGHKWKMAKKVLPSIKKNHELYFIDNNTGELILMSSRSKPLEIFILHSYHTGYGGKEFKRVNKDRHWTKFIMPHIWVPKYLNGELYKLAGPKGVLRVSYFKYWRPFFTVKLSRCEISRRREERRLPDGSLRPYDRIIKKPKAL